MNEFDDTHDDIEWVSKSEMKRDSHRLQAMGERLLGIKKSKLAKFPLNDELLAAIEESKRIKSNEAYVIERKRLQIPKTGPVVEAESVAKANEIRNVITRCDRKLKNLARMSRDKGMSYCSLLLDLFGNLCRSFHRCHNIGPCNSPCAPCRFRLSQG